MTREQKLLLLVLVLLNLIFYGVAFFAAPLLTAQAPVAAQPTVVQLALIAASPTLASPTLTSTPTDTPTLVLWETETPSPTLTQTPVSGTATVTPTRRATVPPGGMLSYKVPTSTRVPTRTRPPATATVVRSPTPQPGGNSSSPRLPTGDWLTLGPNAEVWYKIGEGGNHIDAFLYAKPLEGVRMEVFAPNLWDHPIGAGSPQRSGDSLVWSGGRWEAYGEWLARIVNSNSAPVSYRLVINSNEIPKCEVIGYWEYIGTQLVYWKKCK